MGFVCFFFCAVRNVSENKQTNKQTNKQNKTTTHREKKTRERKVKEKKEVEEGFSLSPLLFTCIPTPLPLPNLAFRYRSNSRTVKQRKIRKIRRKRLLCRIKESPIKGSFSHTMAITIALLVSFSAVFTFCEITLRALHWVIWTVFDECKVNSKYTRQFLCRFELIY